MLHLSKVGVNHSEHNSRGGEEDRNVLPHLHASMTRSGAGTDSLDGWRNPSRISNRVESMAKYLNSINFIAHLE